MVPRPRPCLGTPAGTLQPMPVCACRAHALPGIRPEDVVFHPKTSVVKKSAATSASQCAGRKVCHDVGSSGLGGTPNCLRIVATVDRATRWPRSLEGALEAHVAPTGILGCHPQDQTPNLREHVRPAGPPGAPSTSTSVRSAADASARACPPSRSWRSASRAAGQAARRPHARRRRWSSVNRVRDVRSCSFRTRFSSRRYWMISCCSIGATRDMTQRRGAPESQRRVYAKWSAGFSDTTRRPPSPLRAPRCLKELAPVVRDGPSHACQLERPLAGPSRTVASGPVRPTRIMSATGPPPSLCSAVSAAPRHS